MSSLEPKNTYCGFAQDVPGFVRPYGLEDAHHDVGAVAKSTLIVKVVR